MNGRELMGALRRAEEEIRKVRSVAPQLSARIVVSTDVGDALRSMARKIREPKWMSSPDTLMGHPVDVDERLPEGMVLVRFEVVIA